MDTWYLQVLHIPSSYSAAYSIQEHARSHAYIKLCHYCELLCIIKRNNGTHIIRTSFESRVIAVILWMLWNEIQVVIKTRWCNNS